MTLPILRVKTAHSEYLIDQNAGTVARTPVHEKAANLTRMKPGEPKPYQEILAELEVGGQLVMTYPDGYWTRSTVIESVEEVEQSA